jgi:hypothetical protein
MARDLQIDHSLSMFLMYVENGRRTPSPLEEPREEVDTDECHVSCSWDFGTLDWRLDADVKANVEHSTAHRNGCP